MNSWHRTTAWLLLLFSGSQSLLAQAHDLDQLVDVFSTEKQVTLSSDVEAVIAAIKAGDVVQADAKLSGLPDHEQKLISAWARKSLALRSREPASLDEKFNVAEWVVESAGSAPADVVQAITVLLTSKALRKDLDQKKQRWHPLEFRAVAYRLLTAHRMDPHTKRFIVAYCTFTENIEELRVMNDVMEKRDRIHRYLTPFAMRLLELGQQEVVDIPGTVEELIEERRIHDATEFWLKYPGTGTEMLEQRVSLIRELKQQNTPADFDLVEKLVTYHPDKIYNAPSKHGGLYYAFYFEAIFDAVRRNNLKELEYVFSKIIRDSSGDYLDRRFLCSRLKLVLLDSEHKADYLELLAPMVRKAYTSNPTSIAYILGMAVVLNAEQDVQSLQKLVKQHYLHPDMNEGERSHFVMNILQTIRKPEDQRVLVDEMKNLPFPEKLGDMHFRCIVIFGQFQRFDDMREYATSLDSRLTDQQRYLICRTMMSQYASAGEWQEVLNLSDTFYAFNKNAEGDVHPNFKVNQHVQIAAASSNLGDPDQAADLFLKRFDEQLYLSRFSPEDVKLLHDIPGFATKLKAYLQKNKQLPDAPHSYRHTKGIVLLSHLLHHQYPDEQLIRIIREVEDVDMLAGAIQHEMETRRGREEQKGQQHFRIMDLVLQHSPKEELKPIHELRGFTLSRRKLGQDELLFKLEEELEYAETYRDHFGPNYLRYLKRLGEEAHAMDLVKAYLPPPKEKKK